jgi:hypothetical protein
MASRRPDDDFDLVLNKTLRRPDEDELQQAQRYVDWAKMDLRDARMARNRAERKVVEKRLKVERMRELQREVIAAHESVRLRDEEEG